MMKPPFVPVMKPQLPTAPMIIPYLEEIDRNRHYSNFGPFVTRFQEQLCSHFRVPSGSLITVSNGTLGLFLALQTLEVRPGQFCLMPSWTFAATAAAAVAAGLIPYFIDVDPHTWALDPAFVHHLIQKSQLPVGAVLAVAPFGSPLNGQVWDALTEATGIPVIIDAAAGFDSLQITRSPVMVSLHATKAFGVGEGGFVASTDQTFMERFRQRSVFGFNQSRHAQVPGINGKMSEVTAAIGLAMLDLWPQIRRQLQEVSQLYRLTLEKTIPDKVHFQGDWGRHWISSTCNVFLKSGTSEGLISFLGQKGIETRRWWDKPLHLHPAYKIMPQGELAVTEALGHRVVGLPFYSDLDSLSIHHICESLQTYVHSHALSPQELTLFMKPPKKRRPRSLARPSGFIPPSPRSRLKGKPSRPHVP